MSVLRHQHLARHEADLKRSTEHEGQCLAGRYVFKCLMEIGATFFCLLQASRCLQRLVRWLICQQALYVVCIHGFILFLQCLCNVLSPTGSCKEETQSLCADLFSWQ